MVFLLTAASEQAPTDPRSIVPAETPGIDPVLDAVPVTTTLAVRRAEDGLETAVAAQSLAVVGWVEREQQFQAQVQASANAEAIVFEARDALTRAQATLQADEDELARRRAIETRRREALAIEQGHLRAMAAQLLVSVPDDTFAILGSLDDFTEIDRRSSARSRGVEVQSAAVEAARAPWEEARRRRRSQEQEVATATNRVEAALTGLADANASRDDADLRRQDAQTAAEDARSTLLRAQDDAVGALADRRVARLASSVEDSDLTLVALHAYWRAAQLAPCRIPWWVLAGVGLVETRHGTALGAKVTPEGDTTVKIIGIPLDGRPGVAAIADTDGGRLDNDSVWDRAVGPMQFIPGTWGRWATDADGDGEADPHNLYDAAGAAAAYLCFSRGDLVAEGPIRAALLAYNRSVPYGTKVLDNGGRYRDALDLPELPPALAAD